jgi:peptide/nickel transport system permease protein
MALARYIGRRTLTALLCIFVALCLNFIIIHAAPGNPVRILVGQDNPDAKVMQALTVKYGLDKPLAVQFLRYVGNLARGDMGVSIYTSEAVSSMIFRRLGATFLVAFTGSVLALLAGTALGIFSGRRVGGKADAAIGGVSYLFDAMPTFWLGLMLILLFASILKWLPTAGMADVRAAGKGLEHVLDVARHMVLPVATLSLTMTPQYMRIARSSLAQVLGEDFITTLRAAGMPEKRIYRRYVFRNAILPIVTVFGIHLAYMVAGVAIVEIVFSWPGTGSLIMTAISRRDYPVLMGTYFALSVSVAVVMILVDLLYSALDPRISHARS